MTFEDFDSNYVLLSCNDAYALIEVRERNFTSKEVNAVDLWTKGVIALRLWTYTSYHYSEYKLIEKFNELPEELLI